MQRSDPMRIYEVVGLLKAKLPQRAIARALKISRNTVRKIAASHREARQSPHGALVAEEKRKLPSKLDAFRPEVDRLLREYSDITAQRVFEELQAKGFDGGYTGVKELVRKLRPAKKPTHKAKQANETFIQALVEKGIVGAWYTLEEGSVAEVLFCRTTDTKDLETILAQTPTVKAAKASALIWPQWLSKGVVK